MQVKRLLMFTVFSVILFIPRSSCKDEENVSGVYASLRGFVDDLGKLTGEVMSGVTKLAKGIRQVQEFLDATVEEDCTFQCPDGTTPKPNPDYVPKTNGCGTFGLEEYITHDMLPSSEFVTCCDSHDLCYGKCANDKDDCDLKFKKCLYNVCTKKKETLSSLNYKGCQAGAKLLYMGTTALGCQPYINAQREACICPTSPKSKKDEF